jgi:hypothetical protein
VSVDPFQILHDVEEELANCNGLSARPARARPKYSSFVRASISRKTSFSPRSWGDRR